MDITPLTRSDWQIINGYGNGGFTCRDERHEGSILVAPELVYPLPIQTLADLTLDALTALQTHVPSIELLLVGCGSEIAPIDPELRRTVRDWGIVMEPMDTGAACRTYNVLLVEERRVAAALVAVD
jgi:uncharacterized protein